MGSVVLDHDAQLLRGWFDISLATPVQRADTVDSLNLAKCCGFELSDTRPLHSMT